MGLNVHEGLKALGFGLDRLAQYHAVREEKEWQEQRDAANQAFQERILTLQQSGQMALADKELAARTQENEATRTFTAGENQKSRDSQKELTELQIGASSAQHAQSMSLQQQQLTATIENNEALRSNQELSTRVNGVAGLASGTLKQYSDVTDAMQRELGDLKNNPALQFNAEQRKAAEKEISDRYAPQLTELSTQYKKQSGEVYSLLGIETPKVDAAADPAAAGAGKTPLPPIEQAVSQGMSRMTPDQLRPILLAKGYTADQIEAALKKAGSGGGGGVGSFASDAMGGMGG